MMDEQEIQQRINDIRLKLIRQKVQQARQLVDSRASDDVLERVLATNSQKSGPGFGMPHFGAYGNRRHQPADLSDLVQTIALQTIQFQQIMLSNMVQPMGGFNGQFRPMQMGGRTSMTDSPLMSPTGTAASPNGQAPDLKSAPSPDSKKSNIKSKNDTNRLSTTSIHSGNLQEANEDVDPDALSVSSDIYKEVISEENMRFVRRKVRMVFWAIMFVETARRKSRLGTERRKKVLEDGMSAIFSQFKNSPILNKANDLCKVMSKESGDMTPSKSAFAKFTSFLNSKANPKFTQLLDLFIQLIESLTWDNMMQSSTGYTIDLALRKLLFCHKIYNDFFWRVEGTIIPFVFGRKPWPVFPLERNKRYNPGQLSEAQYTMLLSFYIVLKTLIRMMLAIPVRAQLLTEKDETAAKNLRVVSYFLTRMVRGVLANIMDQPMEEPAPELLRVLEYNNSTAVFTDFNFKGMFKLYDASIKDGEKRIAGWIDTLYAPVLAKYKDMEPAICQSILDYKDVPDLRKILEYDKQSIMSEDEDYPSQPIVSSTRLRRASLAQPPGLNSFLAPRRVSIKPPLAHIESTAPFRPIIPSAPSDLQSMPEGYTTNLAPRPRRFSIAQVLGSFLAPRRVSIKPPLDHIDSTVPSSPIVPSAPSDLQSMPEGYTTTLAPGSRRVSLAQPPALNSLIAPRRASTKPPLDNLDSTVPSSPLIPSAPSDLQSMPEGYMTTLAPGPRRVSLAQPSVLKSLLDPRRVSIKPPLDHVDSTVPSSPIIPSAPSDLQSMPEGRMTTSTSGPSVIRRESLAAPTPITLASDASPSIPTPGASAIIPTPIRLGPILPSREPDAQISSARETGTGQKGVAANFFKPSLTTTLALSTQVPSHSESPTSNNPYAPDLRRDK